MDKEALICDSHSEYYQVPLIPTFRHKGAELWCPFCGAKLGIFDGGYVVPQTNELEDRWNIYQSAATKYLTGETNDWEYNIEAEDIK